MKADTFMNAVGLIDDRYLDIENPKNRSIQLKKKKRKKIIAAGVIAACLCLVSGTVYFTFVAGMFNRTFDKQIVWLTYGGVTMYYGEADFEISDFMLEFKKGEKIEGVSLDTSTWYKVKGADNIKTIIGDDGNNVTKWNFEDYYFDEDATLDMSWIVENVFSIGSKDDIKNITVNDVVCELDDSQKEMLYHKFLELKFPRTDEEQSWMEDISVKKFESDYAELIKLNINTEHETHHFMIDPDSKVFRLDENNVYSLFAVLTDDELSNICQIS